MLNKIILEFMEACRQFEHPHTEDGKEMEREKEDGNCILAHCA